MASGTASRIVTILVLAAIFAAAQIQTGRLSGNVYDPNKAVVPNAMVTVKNSATGIVRVVQTNEIGAYVDAALDPGVYEISVTAPSFRTSVRKERGRCRSR